MRDPIMTLRESDEELSRHIAHGSATVADDTPHIPALTMAERDEVSLDVINRRAAAAVDALLDADTAWAMERCRGLPFANLDARICFLYMTYGEERCHRPMPAVTVARLVRIAVAMHEAERGAA